MITFLLIFDFVLALLFIISLIYYETRLKDLKESFEGFRLSVNDYIEAVDRLTRDTYRPQQKEPDDLLF